MKKIAIIGAGVAGLSAGIYARRNGYEATIYESHTLPGGLCTAWKRNGYTFEGCMHFLGLAGSTPTHVFHCLWKELGVVPRVKLLHNEVYCTLYDRDGRILHLYKDADRLQQELLSHSPDDAKEINILCRTIKRFTCVNRETGGNPFRLMSKAAGILRIIPFLKRNSSTTVGEYAARFKDPLIRYGFESFFVHPDIPCLSLFFFMSDMHTGNFGYPQGSTLTLARAIESTFHGLGGTIEYNKRVVRITVEDGQTTGLELEDGTKVAADIVISAADGHYTLNALLGGAYTTATIKERYATQPLYHSFIQVSFGVNRDMVGTPHMVKAQMPPFEIAGQMHNVLWYQHYAYDPSLAPPGKTSITVQYPSEFAWWETLVYKSEAYKTEKKKILETTMAQLEKVLPGISSQTESTDVSTPYTIRRYTNNWKGAVGFLITTKMLREMYMNTQYTLPGLDRFYMAGMWVKGMGVPVAAASGKEVIQLVCKADKQRFKAG